MHSFNKNTCTSVFFPYAAAWLLVWSEQTKWNSKHPTFPEILPPPQIPQPTPEHCNTCKTIQKRSTKHTLCAGWSSIAVSHGNVLCRCLYEVLYTENLCTLGFPGIYFYFQEKGNFWLTYGNNYDWRFGKN